ncbi:MAG: EAL domain-containing protein, partial [Dokdonella sp.]
HPNHQDFLALVHPEDRDAVGTAFAQSLDQHQVHSIEHRALLAGGRIKYLQERWQIVFDAQGKAVRAVGTCQDVTERKLQSQRVEGLMRVQVMLSGINALVARARDHNQLFNDACKFTIDAGGFRMAFVGILDESKGTVAVAASAGKGRDLLALITETLASIDRASQSMVMTAIREKRAIVANDSRNDPRMLFGSEYTKAGVRSLAIFPLLVDADAVGVFVFFTDVINFFHDEEMELLSEMTGNIAFAMDHIKKSERLDYLAYYDALTDLPNRTLFLDRVGQSIRTSVAADTSLTMVVLDLERFAQINDQLGRTAGDAVLVWVAERLTRTLGDANLLMRVVGDRFALVLSAEFQEADVAQFVERTAAALQQDPLCHKGVVIPVTAKFGVARFPEDGTDADALLKHAEVAVKLAKSSGEMFAYFSNDMNVRSSQRLALADQLRVALDAGQFVLHYQAKVDMISGEIVGAESLIRWQHPDKGLLPPTAFIELAEETGLILPIGAWVIDTVCAQQAMWIASGLRVVPIAVNVSSIQLGGTHFLNTVRAALSKHGISSKLVDIELTESALMNDAAEATGVLQGLRKLGCGLALDDFGTGYSSPAYLKRFAFDSVKIDRSFITDITRNAGDAAIATAIIAMAQSLHLKVVAEGVETLGQFNYLRAHGCDQFQGYFFSPPVPEDVFASNLRSSRRMQLPLAAPDDQRTLLLVDDEPHISAALSRMLRRDGYRILVATGGPEALEMMAINPVQVIISDQRMPQMSGTEFLETVRQMYPDTIRMILSGYTDLQVVTESVNRGAVSKFLTKPWDDDQLRGHVREAFQRFATKVKH